MTKIILTFIFITFSNYLLAQSLPTPPQDSLKKFDLIYDNLYGIDYRKLSIEDFRIYSNTLEDLKSLKNEVKDLLEKNPTEIKHDVFEKSYTFRINWNSECEQETDSILSRVTHTEEEGIRSCYRAGAKVCKIKVSGRVKSLVYAGVGQDGFPICNLVTDAVIEQSF